MMDSPSPEEENDPAKASRGGGVLVWLYLACRWPDVRAAHDFYNAHDTVYLTFDEPVRLPSVTLTAGTYIFEQGDARVQRTGGPGAEPNRSKVYFLHSLIRWSGRRVYRRSVGDVRRRGSRRSSASHRVVSARSADRAALHLPTALDGFSNVICRTQRPLAVSAVWASSLVNWSARRGPVVGALVMPARRRLAGGQPRRR